MFFSFDRLGYELHSRRFVAGDLDVDMTGRVCLVTGANSGLGYALTKGLAQRGATVWMLCRDTIRGEQARQSLLSETGSQALHLVTLDMSDLGAIRRFADSQCPARIDVLVHNAGLLPPTRTVSGWALEATFAVHVVGPHLLTRLLSPALEASGDGRVIWVASGGMYTQRLNLSDLDWAQRAYDGVIAYAQTKRMQVILAHLWAQEAANRFQSYAMHPGWADTPGVASSLPKFHKLTKAVLRTAQQGADTALWLAVRRPAPAPSGAFWFDRKAVTPYLLPWTRESDAMRREFWMLLESVIQFREVRT